MYNRIGRRKSRAVIEEVSDNRQIENVGNGFQDKISYKKKIKRDRDPL